MILGNDWDEILKDEWQKPYLQGLFAFLKEEYAENVIFPPKKEVFNALRYTSFSDTKVVIIGQDPYHGIGQAHGLCFSVRNGVMLPPSLKNIYKELESDVGRNFTQSGDLTYWAKQGVLMLNNVLTVRQGQPQSHKDKGWEVFTDRIIFELNKKDTPVVFLLWGKPAENKAKIITNPLHKKLISVHPSPLSAYRGFFGSRPFSKANEFLAKHGMAPIDWQLPMEEEISK